MTSRLAPYLVAAFGLSFALSRGELVVDPPGWITMPVAIFGLTDRGEIFSGAALTVPLAAATLAVLLGIERLPSRAAGEP